MSSNNFEIARIHVWACENVSSYEAASLSWKRSIATKCEQLAGSLNGYLDPRVAIEPGTSDDLWFAPPGSTFFGAYYADCITMRELRDIMEAYRAYLLDPDRLAPNAVYVDDDASFQRITNLEAYTRFLHGPEKTLASDDLARKRFPRHHSNRSVNLESIANKCITQFHQAWSIICSHLEQSTQHKVDQSQEIDVARSDADIVRVLYELDLMGLKGNRSDQDVRKLYEDQLLQPDKDKIDQTSKFGSSLVGLTNYNNQSKRLYRSATALKSTITLSRFIIGYFRGLHRNFQKQHLYGRVDSFRSFQEAIDYVNSSANGLMQMNEGNWEEPPTNSVSGSKRESSTFYRRGHFDNPKSNVSPSASSLSTSSSSSLASGGSHRSHNTNAHAVFHTDVTEDHDEVDIKEYIENSIARSIEVYAAGIANANNNSQNCSMWMHTGRCWRVDFLAKNPSMDQSQRCRYKHPDPKTFTPPFP